MMMTKKNDETHYCPRCEYPLIPVHSVAGRRTLGRNRRIIALTCPEPYCDHIEFAEGTDIELDEGQTESRQVS